MHGKMFGNFPAGQAARYGDFSAEAQKMLPAGIEFWEWL